MDNIIELTTNIIKALVMYPDDVKVVESKDEFGVLLSVGININDMGRVIGREGSIAKALRTLLRAMGMKLNGQMISLKVLEPEGNEYRHSASDIYPADVGRKEEETMSL